MIEKLTEILYGLVLIAASLVVVFCSCLIGIGIYGLFN
jgi:hypothetical protein